MSSIGANIKQARLKKGLTQQQLASRCVPPIADSAIRKYESGTVIPKMEMTNRIATALGITVYELMHYNSVGIERFVESFSDVTYELMMKAQHLDYELHGKDTPEKSTLDVRTDMASLIYYNIHELKKSGEELLSVYENTRTDKN